MAFSARDNRAPIPAPFGAEAPIPIMADAKALTRRVWVKSDSRRISPGVRRGLEDKPPTAASTRRLVIASYRSNCERDVKISCKNRWGLGSEPSHYLVG